MSAHADTTGDTHQAVEGAVVCVVRAVDARGVRVGLRPEQDTDAAGHRRVLTVDRGGVVDQSAVGGEVRRDGRVAGRGRQPAVGGGVEETVCADDLAVELVLHRVAQVHAQRLFHAGEACSVLAAEEEAALDALGVEHRGGERRRGVRLLGASGRGAGRNVRAEHRERGVTDRDARHLDSEKRRRGHREHARDDRLLRCAGVGRCRCLAGGAMLELAALDVEQTERHLVGVELQFLLEFLFGARRSVPAEQALDDAAELGALLELGQAGVGRRGLLLALGDDRRPDLDLNLLGTLGQRVKLAAFLLGQLLLAEKPVQLLPDPALLERESLVCSHHRTPNTSETEVAILPKGKLTQDLAAGSLSWALCETEFPRRRPYCLDGYGPTWTPLRDATGLSRAG